MGNHVRIASVIQLGVVPYSDALELQRLLHREVADGLRPDTLVLLEHPHVYTLGRRGVYDDILVGSDRLDRLGIEVHETDRGGEVTYHGPGQLVAYPIINLRRWGGGPLRYVRALERTVIAALAELGITAQTEGHPTGVWVEDRKIAAIGVKVGRRVTTHGFALNISTDLSYFENIVPCGMPGARVTSISRELGCEVDVDDVAPIVANWFGREFDMKMVTSSLDAPRSVSVDTLGTQ